MQTTSFRGSSVKPTSFSYHAPERLEEAGALLAEHGDDAKPFAGGQSLVPMLALRLASFEHLVDLNRVAGLAGIERSNGHLRIGATVRQATAEHSAEVAASVPLLAKALPHIGHFQIRNRGTVGGSIAHADPACELPAVALALDATIEAAGPSGLRTSRRRRLLRVDVDDRARRRRDPVAPSSSPSGAGQAGSRSRRWPAATATSPLSARPSASQLDGDEVTRAAIALFGVGPTPVRAADAEAALSRPVRRAAISPTVGRVAASGLHPTDDIHASGAYRKQVAAVIGAPSPRRGHRGGPVMSDRSHAISGALLPVNGSSDRTAGRSVEPRKLLSDVLREDLPPHRHPHRLRARCMRCLHGHRRRRRRALLPACSPSRSSGAEITTVEGCADRRQLNPFQQAMQDYHGLQCGFCTPGFVVSMTAYLADNADPTDDDLRDALSGNLCRCTGYQGIINAARQAAGLPVSNVREHTDARNSAYQATAGATSASRSSDSRIPGCSRPRSLCRRRAAAGHAARRLRPLQRRSRQHHQHRHLGRARRCRACTRSTPVPISTRRVQQFWHTMLGPPPRAGRPYQATRPLRPLADGDVRFVGDPIAIVIADNRYIAEDACRPGGGRDRVAARRSSASGTSAKDDASWCITELESNIVEHMATAGGSRRSRRCSPSAAHVINRRFRQCRATNVPMEPRGIVVHYDRCAGDLQIWAATQSVQRVEVMRRPPDRGSGESGPGDRRRRRWRVRSEDDDDPRRGRRGDGRSSVRRVGRSSGSRTAART